MHLPTFRSFRGFGGAFALSVLLSQTASALDSNDGRRPVDFVDPFIGSSNSRWQLFPGPTLPFGLVKLSPDNQGNVWNGGYEYTISSISGFSHVHAMGLSALSVMPITGPLNYDPSSSRFHGGAADSPFGGMWTAGYHSRFLKETEKARPGYYGVTLADFDIKAELSATLRCGFLRFTFPETKDAHILLNLDFPTEELTTVLAVDIEQTAPDEISGSVRQKNGYAGDHIYHFVMQFSRAPESLQLWHNEPYTGNDKGYGTDWRRHCQVMPLKGHFKGADSTGVIVNYSTHKGEAIVVRTGLSYVSLENARLNLKTEGASMGFDFDQVVSKAEAVWNQLLSSVEVEGGEPLEKKKFYSAFYRSFCGKSLLNDVNGEYLDSEGNRQQLKAPADAVYSSDAFWGTQWNLTPLWTLVAPKYAESMANSLLELAEKGGWIPEAPVALKYSPIMGAQHQNTFIESLYQKGLSHFDPQKAYAAIRHDLTTPGEERRDGGFAGNRQLASYMKYGYIADEDGPVSSTMEYAYDDWCLGQFALALGKHEDAELFERRSKSYKNVFDPKVGYVRRKHQNGSWVEPFDPFAYGTEGGWNGPGFVEGNAWVYTYFVPHDLNGLVDLLGRETAVQRLENGFKNDHVDLSNQPNLQAPFLFNYFGKPWLTQKYSRLVAREYYSDTPYFGWKGEEDEGQLTSLYVLLAMGLFEMDGGCSVTPGYDLSSPIFSKIVIHLDPVYFKGKTFVIEVENQSVENVYIQSATLNGAPLTSPVLPWASLREGGTLHYVLGSEPNFNWGVR